MNCDDIIDKLLEAEEAAAMPQVGYSEAVAKSEDDSQL